MLVEFSPPPSFVDRLIIHQFDAARPSPGGIDTCLRGIARYFPRGKQVAFVGVDTGEKIPGRKVGQWERHNLGGEDFWFLPAIALDPANQSRKMPHSVRLLFAVLRYWRRLPSSSALHIHRMDIAAAIGLLSSRPVVYFVHTQENGLTGATSDSFWRFFGDAHRSLEKRVAERARAIMVFNEEYAAVVRRWNERTHFFPTWYDPALIDPKPKHSNRYALVWVGRLEVPKDPELAVHAFEHLVEMRPDLPWTLEILGSGTRYDEVKKLVAGKGAAMHRRITLHGRVGPNEVASIMADGGLFLMTSHPGYEGYARVLVEAMASGLPAVVTHGSDTGGIVRDGITGYVCSRDPKVIAGNIVRALNIESATVSDAVAGFDAPTLVERIFRASA